MAENEHYRYHGRVLRQDGWVVLQYWLFYPFNDWRSGFFGANDHEADWEKVFSTSPRRRTGRSAPNGWPTRHTTTRGTTSGAGGRPRGREGRGAPVIYVGAGSHASYFAQGEYLTELTVPLPGP